MEGLAAERVVAERESGDGRERDERQHEAAGKEKERLEQEGVQRTAFEFAHDTVAGLHHRSPAGMGWGKRGVANAGYDKAFRGGRHVVEAVRILDEPPIDGARQTPRGVRNETSNHDGLAIYHGGAAEDARIAAIAFAPCGTGEEQASGSGRG